MPTDLDLYLRGAETLIASWEEYARGAARASVQRCPGVAVAVFPNEPESAVHNNALFERHLATAKRVDAVDAMEAAYAAAAVGDFAAWVHETTRQCVPISNRGLRARYIDARNGHGARRYSTAPAPNRARATGLVGIPPHYRRDA